ncbi:MAG: mitochondrial fission ELM1 family protein [Desulfofustis sp.]|nr:mitochondrial fission ELM1 family protein [Desulfofustis sp.]
MDKLRITLFRDGRPGHLKQSRGIVCALRRYVDVEVAEVEVIRRSILFDVIFFAAYLLGRQSPQRSEERCDLVLGAGSRTHLPMLSYARDHLARSVVCMTPPWPLRSRFDLCCSPIHDRVRPADNLFLTIGPPNSAVAGTSHQSDIGLFCIGGEDGASHVWDDDRIVTDVRRVIERSALRAWIITSSPRTPKTTEVKCAALAAAFPEVTFVPFDRTEPGWIEQQYHDHGTVWITADSISMVYEALTAGCRVGIIPVRWRKKESKFAYSERYLVDKKLVVSLSRWLDNPEQWGEHEPLDEADRCAREIIKRWWPSNLR